MYEQVEHKNMKKERSLWLVLTIWTIVVLIVGALVIWGFRYRPQFTAFLGEYSNSIRFAQENKSMRVTVNGETFLPLPRNVQKFYNLIAIAGIGRQTLPPDEQADVLITFGDGASLEMWEAKLQNSTNGRETGLLICYTNTEGERYAYDSDRLTLSKFPLKNPAAALN